MKPSQPTAIKLSAVARQNVREAIRLHPDATKYVRNSTEISNLKKDQLIDLATKLGIDFHAMLESTEYDFRHQGSDEHMPFSGVIKFPITIQAFGHSVVARCSTKNGHGNLTSTMPAHAARAVMFRACQCVGTATK